MANRPHKRRRVRLDDGDNRKLVSFPKNNSDLLTAVEAAGYLRLSAITLAKLRCADGGGPPYYKLTAGKSGRVAYRIADLNEWLEGRKRQNTSADDALILRRARRG